MVWSAGLGASARSVEGWFEQAAAYCAIVTVAEATNTASWVASWQTQGTTKIDW